jgi:four helix bundle protein
MQDHRKLRAWHLARELALDVRRASLTFPRAGYASLRTQITRAAESVVFTIAEGCGAASQPEFARFLDMSIKSANEIEAQLELARDYEVLNDSVWQAMAPRVIVLRRMLYALRSKVLSTPSKPPRSSETERQRPGERVARVARLAETPPVTVNSQPATRNPQPATP